MAEGVVVAGAAKIGAGAGDGAAVGFGFGAAVGSGAAVTSGAAAGFGAAVASGAAVGDTLGSVDESGAEFTGAATVACSVAFAFDAFRFTLTTASSSSTLWLDPPPGRMPVSLPSGSA
ncbi:hypothetical protein [Sanguibacter gelidistatuariae]|uniref:hypothetical protein n=1 Tax=Sanguibacter gelidistatuariae TaxID=1814289 RepID=UPI000B810C69|nr:hypothetical protein [Sanguibacter gelidistatuariae]